MVKSFRVFEKEAAFTLAEVLIVIGAIGVVAAITIPTLIPLIKDKVDKNRKEVIEDRLIQGMNQLNTLDDGFNASQYAKEGPDGGTEGFVRALSKHYKMSQICGAENLKDCFPYGTINYTDENGDATANIEDLKTPEAFKLSSDDYYAPAGFISAQGTPFIMLLKKDCIMDTGTGMRSIPTSCVQYMYDNNGSGIPNKLDKDIAHSPSLGIASIASDDGGDSSVEPDGTFDTPISAGGKTYTKYYIAYPIQSSDNPKINTCADTTSPGMGGGIKSYCTNNYWAGAIEACKALGEDYELPPKEALQELYCRLTGKSNSYYSCSTPITKDIKLEEAFTAKGASLTGRFWSLSTGQNNITNSAYYVGFTNGQRNASYVSNGFPVLCLGK